MAPIVIRRYVQSAALFHFVRKKLEATRSKVELHMVKTEYKICSIKCTKSLDMNMFYTIRWASILQRIIGYEVEKLGFSCVVKA